MGGRRQGKAIYCWSGSGSAKQITTGAGKAFSSPNAIAFDASGSLFIADTGNNLIRRYTPDGAVITIAGGGGLEEDTLGVRMRLDRPWGLAFEASATSGSRRQGGGASEKSHPADISPP
ncbi:MAG: hypothetical protein WKF37_15550 [Bryobacteraceae bacterium]